MFKYFVLTIVLSLTVLSCKKDPENISGCTDILADNYSADAIEEDNSCTYVNRFSGTYVGVFECEELLNAILTEQEVIISQFPGDRTKIMFDVMTDFGNLSFVGNITSPNTIEIDDTLKDLEVNLRDLFNGADDKTVRADFKIISEMTISTDNKSLTGDVFGNLTSRDTFEIGGIPFNGISFNDNCTFVGTKR